MLQVSLPVVRKFVKQVEETALGVKVVKGIKPDQQLVKVVNDQLIELMGGKQQDLVKPAKGPQVSLPHLQQCGMQSAIDCEQRHDLLMNNALLYCQWVPMLPFAWVQKTSQHDVEVQLDAFTVCNPQSGCQSVGSKQRMNNYSLSCLDVDHLDGWASRSW